MAANPGDPASYGLSSAPGAGSGGAPSKKKKAPVPIGVPPDYKLTVPNPGDPFFNYGPADQSGAPTLDLHPQYFKGDGWRLMPKSPQDIQTLQQALIQTAMLDPKGVVFGQWDAKSAAAYEKLLGVANASGVNWQDALSSRLASVANGDLTTKQKAIPPLTINLTNPDDIKAVIQNTAKTLTGGVWSDTDVQNMVTQYQAQERRAQTDAYNQKYDPNANGGVSGGVQYVGGYAAGGESTNAPTGAGLGQQVHDSLIAAHPADAAVATFSSQLGSILGSLGWGGKGG